MSTDKRLFLKPGEGRTVRREEDGEAWPVAGDYAENTQFIRRRIADGDLVVGKPDKPTSPDKTKPAGDDR